MPPKTTIWRLDGHTRGKHYVLRFYLNAWLPVMARWERRLLFIDGFSGPGEYQGDEEGSPQIGLTIKNVRWQTWITRLQFLTVVLHPSCQLSTEHL